jgi:hypothetical protein
VVSFLGIFFQNFWYCIFAVQFRRKTANIYFLLFSENLSIVIGPNLLWSNDGSPVSAGMEIVNSVLNENIISKSEYYRVKILRETPLCHAPF